jgi:hypothetical protein
VLQVALLVEALGVAFGIAGDADAEVVAGAGELDELVGVAEAALGLDERGLSGGRIAAQGEHVADAGVPEVVEDAADLVGGVADAGQVGHRADLELVLDAGDEIDGLLAGGAAGAVRDADVGRLEGVQFADGGIELGPAGLVPGGEELEGDCGEAEVEEAVDAHRNRVYVV